MPNGTATKVNGKVNKSNPMVRNAPRVRSFSLIGPFGVSDGHSELETKVAKAGSILDQRGRLRIFVHRAVEIPGFGSRDSLSCNVRRPYLSGIGGVKK